MSYLSLEVSRPTVHLLQVKYESALLIERHTAGSFSYYNSMTTECVNKSASLKDHFFLGKLYVSFEKVYNNMIGNINIISFYRIFVLCNLDVWFRNYGKSCEVPPNLFGLIH